MVLGMFTTCMLACFLSISVCTLGVTHIYQHIATSLRNLPLWLLCICRTADIPTALGVTDKCQQDMGHSPCSLDCKIQGRS